MKILTSGISGVRFRASLLIRELEKNRREAFVRLSTVALFRLDAAHPNRAVFENSKPMNY
jgi:hypothetical protein